METPNKDYMLDLLKEEFNGWETLLGQLTEEQITARQLPADLSVKDIIAHLWMWQQLSVARLEAALNNTEPHYDGWPENLEPDLPDNTDTVNAWIHDLNRDKSWEQVHTDWQARYRWFLELGEQIPEQDLYDPKRYAWLNGYPLFRVLEGSYEHHHVDHRMEVTEWLRQHGILKDTL